MSFLEKKIPPPIAAIVTALLMASMVAYFPPIALSGPLTLVLVGLFFVIGIVIDIAALTRFKQARTSISPLKPENASVLIQSGIYRYSRNPMYLGLVCFLLAWACFLASPATLICILGFIVFIQRFQIEPEERALEERFGQTYIQYKANVRTWL